MENQTMDIIDEKSYRDNSSEAERASSSSSSYIPPVQTPPLRQKKTKISKKRKAFSIIFTSINLIFIAFNLVYYIRSSSWIKFQKHYCPDLPFSPKDTGIKYQNDIMELTGRKNPFGGELGPSVDKAWDDLMDSGNIRLTTSEMASIGELQPDSVALEHGGYLGTLRVFHELHCMDWIKRKYSDLNATYPSDIEAAATPGQTYRDQHFDHCLNLILQGVQCRADMTTSSWFVKESNMNKPLINRRNATRTCVNWNTVDNWLESRRIKRHADGGWERTVDLDGNTVEITELFGKSKPT